MRIIKKIFLIIYIIFLGFIVFYNTSVFADEPIYTTNQSTPNYVSSAFDDYFINMQDEFDYNLFYQPRSGFQQMLQVMNQRFEDPNYLYYIEKGNTGYGSGGQQNGYIIWFYNSAQASQQLQFNTDFKFAEFTDINSWSQYNDEFYYPAVTVNSYFKYVIYNWGQSFAVVNNGSTEAVTIPFCCLNYTHPIYHNYYLESSTNGGIADAINNQTNTIVNETQKQTNAITTATQQQTNELLDTNNTGNETMSVNDTTSDTSADLSNFFNNLNDNFTNQTTINLSTQKDFVFTLPNGQSFNVSLKTSFFRNFLDSQPILKAFYQAIYWVIFGGFVIFDFKKIINKMKEGNIDNVVGSSSPVDNVVNMSLK